mmetsp:Transcript_36969/g.89818  ORF Transcript_36969/g.89818 Transcript_36969/m.89818 type:complete len:83 (+) Transcript_36969:128-376(+)
MSSRNNKRKHIDYEEEGQSIQPKNEEISFVYTGQSNIPRNITHLIVGPSVKSIKERTFQGYKNLRSAVIYLAPWKQLANRPL